VYFFLARNDIDDFVFFLLLSIFKTEMLMVGCGNAPFSEEMFKLGYTRQINIDNCALVIEQQIERAPHMFWEVADVREMKFETGRFGVVFDKGLLDNLYCYCNAEDNAKAAIVDMYRTLKPGGMFVVLSCHEEEEIKGTLSCDPYLRWHDMMILRLRNPRFPSTRVSFYTMVVAIKSLSIAAAVETAEESSGSGSALSSKEEEGQVTTLPSPEKFMNLISPEDGGKIVINEEEAAAMKVKTEELNAQSRAAMMERQNQLKQQQQQAAAAAQQFEDAPEGGDNEYQPPNGSLADQLSMRRGSLRKVDLPVPPPLSAIIGSETTTEHIARDGQKS
jgi:SAM-dependent methyltransferase